VISPVQQKVSPWSIGSNPIAVKCPPPRYPDDEENQNEEDEEDEGEQEEPAAIREPDE
jgi:hypothetical protein